MDKGLEPAGSYGVGDTQETKRPPEKEPYADVEELRAFLAAQLNGKKFMLDCGHRVTFGYFLGNDITIRNGKIMKIICSQCGY